MIDERSKAPFEQLSDTNRGPLIIVAAYIFLISALPAVVVKIWTRAATARKLIHTDWLMIASYIFAVGQTIALTISVNRGLGERREELSNSRLEATSKAFYASSILTVPALACAKASVTLLIISIQARGVQTITRACYGLLGVIGAWMVAGVLALAFQCDLPAPWAMESQSCVDQYALRIALAAIDVLTDLAVIGLAFFMMRPVQVPTMKKAAVVAMFGTRLAVVPFSIVAVVTFESYYGHRQDRTWFAFAPSIWTSVALNISIITACIPSMKRFLADIQSGLMGATISESYEMTHSSGKAGPQLSGTNLRSIITNRFRQGTGNRSQIQSRTEKDDQMMSATDEWYAARSQAKVGKVGKSGDQVRETESVKGLTDHVIHQRIDYEVEYEEREVGVSEGRSSDQKSEFRY